MEKRFRKRKKQSSIKILIGILITGVLIIGVKSSRENKKETLGELMLTHMEQELYEKIITTYAPVLKYEENDKREYFEQVLPIYTYVKNNEGYRTATESELTYEMILAKEAADENHIDEKTGELVGDNEAPISENTAKVSFSKEKLADFDYLIQNFYTVDRTTTITGQQLNAEQMLSKNMKLQKDVNGPQVLIYHTHSQEGYVDSVEGDLNTTVVGVGDYLTELLEKKYRIQVLHHKGTYDVGDRDHAYSNAEKEIQQILADNPSIEVVIDLHRDGVADTTRLVTEMNGKQVATIMFFNGLSRTTALGDISYLQNPYIQDNLAFSFQMQLKAAEYYPGFVRPIYLKGYRYNMHFKPKSLLVEVGAQTNTLQEAKNAMEPLADILYKVVAE